MPGDLLLLALLWGLWCFLHSFFVARPVARLFRRHLGPRFRYFRILYNLFAAATLVPILLWSATLPCSRKILSWEELWIVAQGIFWLLAIALFWSGTRVYPLREFIGLAQLRGASERPNGEGERRLVREGVLAVVRHPWYAAAILVLWGRNLDAPALVTAVVLTLYLLIGYRLEEARLVEEFGASYLRYRREVSALVPWKWLRDRWRRGV